MQGQYAIGGYLAAKNRQHRCSVFIIIVEHKIPGDRGRSPAVVVEQRAHPGIGPHDVVAGYRCLKIFTRSIAQIVDFTIVDFCGTFGIAPRLVGCADKRMIAFIGNGENDAPVLILENIAVVAFIFALHNNMTAFDQTQFCGMVAAVVHRRDRINPWAGGIHQNLRLLGLLLTILPNLQVPVIRTAIQSDTFRTGPDVGSPVCGVTGSKRNEPGILDPAIGIGKSLSQALLQRVTAMVLEQIYTLGSRQDVATTQMIV